MCPGGDGLGHVAGVADATIGDNRYPALFGDGGRLLNSRDLRHANAGNHPRSADRAGPNADLYGVGPGGNQVRTSLGGRHVAGHNVYVPVLLDPPYGLHHVGRVAVGAINDQDVHALGNQTLPR